MDNDLALLLEQPFIARHTDGAGVMGNSERLQKKANKNESVAVMLRMGNEIQAHNQFRNSLKEALKPHLLLANLLQQSFFSPDVPPAAQKALEDKGSGFHNHITDIIKQFKIYIETASDEILEKEAQRLERRYFQNTGSQNQIEFIKFRRYYEKLKTFNEAAKKHWREIQKHLDTFALVTETADIVNTVSRHDIQNLTRLMRQTDSYLESLKGYLRIEKDEYDNITHSYRIELAYESSLNYSRSAFFGESQEEEEKGSDESEESQEEREGEAGAPEEFEGSIARNIILETKEHRLNSASTLSVPILGSRDWNRTPHYRMEVPVRDYNSCLVKFKISHMVVIDQKSVQTHMTTAAALVRKGTGAKVLPQYIKLIQEALDTISVDIIMKDYPGLANPLVFLYYCGPKVFYSILLAMFQQRNIGEIFYLDDIQNIIREYPMEIIRKELIDWWNHKFAGLNREDVDSYLYYSQILDMIKKDYRVLYDEGGQLRRKEQPSSTYLGLEKWLRDNRNRVFGLRKVEIFKRFIPGTILE